MFKGKLIGVLVLGLMISNLGCSKTYDLEDKNPKKEIVVGAASGLQFAFTEIGKKFEEETGIKVIFNFGSSGIISDQIAHGAPFDVFASADTKFVEKIKKLNLTVPGSEGLYAIGRIALVTEKDSGVPIKTLEDLLRPEIVKIAIANPEHAPYGRAAKEALEATGLWVKIKGKLVYGNNISEALNLVKTGNAEVGLVALSLVDPEIMDFTLIEDSMHKPLEKVITVVKSGSNKEGATQFIQFVQGPEGKKILKKHGFIVPE